MLTQYLITLYPDRPCLPQPEWGYRLYAALLEHAPPAFGAAAHQGTLTPVSQFLLPQRDALRWTVNLLGAESEAALSGVVEGLDTLFLSKDQVTLQVMHIERQTVADVDALFAASAAYSGLHALCFQTATAFKSQGQYLSLPTTRLILQSLTQKWNGCMTECPIEDEDGQGMEALAAGLQMRDFRLQSRLYHLKGRPIPGFTGTMTLENRLTGFHRTLADALLLFSSYAGVGIKTTLGMGGVTHRPRK
jgi:CRISPR-associated endoribonuclease Cas6